MDKFNKDDAGKVMMSLLEPDFLEGVAEVLTQGGKKYGFHNWKTLPLDEQARYKDALMRHTNEFMRGNSIDPDSGMDHLLHVACNCMFLIYFDRLSIDAVEARHDDKVDSMIQYNSDSIEFNISQDTVTIVHDESVDTYPASTTAERLEVLERVWLTSGMLPIIVSGPALTENTVLSISRDQVTLDIVAKSLVTPLEYRLESPTTLRDSIKFLAMCSIDTLSVPTVNL